METEAGVSLATVYCEFEDVRSYKEAVALARSADVPVGLATMRIIKPGEEGLLQLIADCEPDACSSATSPASTFFASTPRTCR